MEAPKMSDEYIRDEITAIINGLGKLDENDGTYMKDRDCKTCLKELLRFLGSDNKRHVTRCAIGSLNIVKNDLIPLINQYCDYHEGDPELFTITLRLATNLTSSILLLYENEEKSSESEHAPIKTKLLNYLFQYKEAFADDEKIWSTMNLYLRHELDDEVTFERIIILIRNILHIPVDSRMEFGLQADSNAHDMCLYRMVQSGILNTIIKLASETQKGAEYCFHIMEIVYLMLRDQNPRTIAQAQHSQIRKKLDKEDPDKIRHLELSKKNRLQRKAQVHRSSRITGCFLVSNKRSLSDQPLITHSHEKFIKLDKGKQEVRKAKNKKPIMFMDSMVISDTVSRLSKASYGLKLFCKLFVEKVFNNYMQQIKHNLIQKKAQDNDETYYLWAMQFFIPFVYKLKLKNEYILEALSTSTLHFIQILISGYQDQLKVERNNFLNISLRLHMALRSYREILMLIKSNSEESEFETVAKTIKKNIFNELEYSTLLLGLFQQYNEPKHSLHYIRDLIETNHLFLEILDDYAGKNKDDSENSKVPQADIFMTRYCHPDVIIVYTRTLKNFRTNENSTNLAILKFFERIVYQCRNHLILTQASVLRCLLDIVATKQLTPEMQEGYLSITKELVENFGAKANKRRWMYQELLFWKTNNDVSEIENQIDPPPVVIDETSADGGGFNYDADKPEEEAPEDAEVAQAFEALEAFEPTQRSPQPDLGLLLASSPSNSSSPIPDLPSTSEPPSPSNSNHNQPTQSPESSQPLDPLDTLESLETLLTDI